MSYNPQLRNAIALIDTQVKEALQAYHDKNIQPINGKVNQRINSQIEQTLRFYHRKNVEPLQRMVKSQRKTILTLTKQIQETQARTGIYKLDLSKVRQNATAKEHRPLKETELKSIAYNLESEKSKSGSANESTNTQIRDMDKRLSGF